MEDAQRSTTAFAGFGSAGLIDSEECRLRIDIAFPVMPMFSGLAVVDTSGAVVCSSAPAGEGAGPGVADHPWFQRLVATRDFTISLPLIEPGAERAVIVFSAPVFDRAGTLTGAAYGSLALTDLSDLLRGSLTADMAFATISDTTGLIVTRSDNPEAWQGEQLGPADYPTLGSGPDWEVLQGPDLEGGFRVIGRVDLERYGWRVYSGLSSQDLLEPGYGLARIESFAGLLLLAFAFLLATWVYRDVGGWLDDLADGVRLAATGEAVALPDGAPAELRTVSAALNSALEKRKHAEGRHRDFLQHAPFGVCAFTAEGHFVDVNPALAEMLGYDTAIELREAGLSALQPTPGVLPDWVRKLDPRAVVDGLETIWMSKAGSPVHVRLSGRIMERESGSVVLEVIVDDVSERRRLEELTRHQQKTEAIGRLAGGVAHEINNILGVVVGYTAHLVSGLAPDSPKHAEAEEIRKAVARGSEITRKLLMASRKDHAPPNAIDVNEALLDLEPMFKGVLPDNIHLECGDNPDAGRIWFNRGHLDQVLLNLVVNARDAMPRGGVLSISTERRHTRHEGPMTDYLVLIVEDTGTGMDERTMKRAFEPFFTTKPMESGTGLGLAMVAGLVEQAGGHVSVTSTLGQGSIFEVWFPSTERAPTEETLAAHGASAAGLLSPDHWREFTGTGTVLLVEDEAALRRLLKAVLEHAGYDVIDAGTAEAALALVSDPGQTIDIVVTDVMLPHMNGPDLIRELALDIPHLFMSGYSADDLPLDRDSVPLLEKPFGLEEFLFTVQKALTAD